MSPVYCYCSAGWCERLFSSVFNRPVTVNKIDTILNGNDKCVFEVVCENEAME
jgi:predicted hydrocarbon binding protein